MSIAVNTIREKLHYYIDHVADKRLKAFYAMVEPEIEEGETIYTETLKMELDQRYSDYKTGKSKMVTASGSKKRVQKILKDKFKK